jgi:hypothetical protein
MCATSNIGRQRLIGPRQNPLFDIAFTGFQVRFGIFTLSRAEGAIPEAQLTQLR